MHSHFELFWFATFSDSETKGYFYFYGDSLKTATIIPSIKCLQSLQLQPALLTPKNSNPLRPTIKGHNCAIQQQQQQHRCPNRQQRCRVQVNLVNICFQSVG